MLVVISSRVECRACVYASHLVGITYCRQVSRGGVDYLSTVDSQHNFRVAATRMISKPPWYGYLVIVLLLLIAIVTKTVMVYFLASFAASKQEIQLAGAPLGERFEWSERSQDWVIADNGNGGEVLESSEISSCKWPKDHRKSSKLCTKDRIIEQLQLNKQAENKEFKINIANDHSQPTGKQIFMSSGCRVNKCSVTHNQLEADVIIFPNSDVQQKTESYDELGEKIHSKSRSEQIWIAYLLESPDNTFDRKFKRQHRGVGDFNWTATYRSDSTIVTPYSKFVPYASKLDEFFAIKNEPPIQIQNSTLKYDIISLSDDQRRKISAKQGKVVWFVSNCFAKNGRLEYAKELSKFIKVDIYGKCGTFKCDKHSSSLDCDELIDRNYKFYLSFENSNSREYITEKLYKNALGYNDQDRLVVPIVMGPDRQDYEKLAPPGSFIHVDDFKSPEELAKYLDFLDANHEHYYAYFRWKKLGRFIETEFLCRVCALMHETLLEGRTNIIHDLQSWWLNEEEIE